VKDINVIFAGKRNSEINAKLITSKSFLRNWLATVLHLQSTFFKLVCRGNMRAAFGYGSALRTFLSLSQVSNMQWNLIRKKKHTDSGSQQNSRGTHFMFKTQQSASHEFL